MRTEEHLLPLVIKVSALCDMLQILKGKFLRPKRNAKSILRRYRVYTGSLQRADACRFVRHFQRSNKVAKSPQSQTVVPVIAQQDLFGFRISTGLPQAAPNDALKTTLNLGRTFVPEKMPKIL